jgi:pentatricopeptide repeat protein
MSILKASRCLVPLLKRAGPNRIIQIPLALKYHHFRFLTTATTTDTSILTPVSPKATQVSNAQGSITTVIEETTDNENEDSEEPNYLSKEELDEAWNDYLERSKHERVPADEIMNLGRQVKYGGGENAIIRMQTLLKDLNARRGLREYQQVFDQLCGMLIHLFGTMGDVESAHIVFNGLVASSRYVRASTVYTLFDVIRFSGTRKDLFKLLETLEDRNLFPQTAVCYTRLINVFRTFRDLHSCRFYFSEMLKRGLATGEYPYRIMIYAYKEAKRPEGVMDIYNQMKLNNVEPSPALFAVVLAVLKEGKKSTLDKNFQIVAADLRNSGLPFTGWTYALLEVDPKEALDEMSKNGTSAVVADYNAFLTHYVKRNQIQDALDIYNILKKDESVSMDKYSYTIMMDLLVKAPGQTHQAAFDLYQEMKENDIKPDRHTFSTLLFACNQTRDLSRAVQYFEEMEGFNIKPNIFSFNALFGVISVVDMPSSNRWDLLKHTWEKMSLYHVAPDTRTYNNYLAAIARLVQPVQNDPDSSEDSLLWPKPEEQVPRPVKEILETYRHMKTANYEQGIVPDFMTYTIVIAALCKGGQLRPALKVYDDTKLTDYKLPSTTYNHIMISLENAGKPSEVMNIWHDMRIREVLPDSNGYEIVLDVCEQMGLVDSLAMIRQQRKLDADRLLELEQMRSERINKA